MDHENGLMNYGSWRVRQHGKLIGPHTLPSGNLPEILNEHEATLRAVAFAPDDSCIARIARLNVVVVNSFLGGKIGPDKIIKCPTHLSCLAFGPEHKNMYLVRSVSLDDDGSNNCNGDAADTDGKSNSGGKRYRSFVLATGHKNGSIRLWDSWSTQIITTLMSHRQRVTDLMFSPNGVGNDGNPLLISISVDKKLNVWDFEYHGYNMSFSLKMPTIGLCCDWHPSGKFFALSGTSRTPETYNIFDRSDGSHGQNQRVLLKHKLYGHSAAVVRCKYTPDGSFLITASWDTKVNMWNSYTGALIQSFCQIYPAPTLLFTTQLRDVACDASLSAIATMNSEGQVTIWNPIADEGIWDKNDNDKLHKVITQAETELCLRDQCLTTLTFSHSGNYLLLSNDEGNATIFALQKPVSSLMHQCRSKIRSLVLEQFDEKIEDLGMPKTLQAYLRYESF